VRSQGSTTGDAENDRPQYPIESVDNALRLLLMFRDRDRLRLVDASAALGVAHSTAHRLMAMLTYHGFVRREPDTKLYLAGPALLDVGLSVVRRMDIRTAARPIMETLAEEIGETVHLATLEGANVRFIDAVESPQALRVAARTGRVLPAHCTSVGKALLAHLDKAELRALYPGSKLVAQTSHSISRRRQLELALDELRERGYAVNEEESEEGVGSIGVAILRPSGVPVAGMSIAAPMSRFKPAQREKMAAVALDAAERLAASVG